MKSEERSWKKLNRYFIFYMLLGCVGTGQYLLKNTLSKAGREAGERGGTNPQIYKKKTYTCVMKYICI